MSKQKATAPVLPVSPEPEDQRDTAANRKAVAAHLAQRLVVAVKPLRNQQDAPIGHPHTPSVDVMPGEALNLTGWFRKGERHGLRLIRERQESGLVQVLDPAGLAAYAKEAGPREQARTERLEKYHRARQEARAAVAADVAEARRQAVAKAEREAQDREQARRKAHSDEWHRLEAARREEARRTQADRQAAEDRLITARLAEAGVAQPEELAR